MHVIRPNDSIWIHGGNREHRPMWTARADVVSVDTFSIVVRFAGEAEDDIETFTLDSDGWKCDSNPTEPISITRALFELPPGRKVAQS